ncbi:MAG: hypothetical protein COA42_00470 [Alteromonadaceae bacterium]|nr:MAG: hypothetical protein COA42_00470 [Alteromonadaceae bacterium]
MNAVKFEFGEFVVYLSRPISEQTIYSHRHEDFLSYVVFWRKQPILVDPGRLSYSRQEGCAMDVHNGLGAIGRPILPMYRFFFGRRLRSEPRRFEQTNMADGASIIVENKTMGVEKRLLLKYDSGLDELVITEEVYCQDAREMLFTLNAPSRNILAPAEEAKAEGEVSAPLNVSVCGVENCEHELKSIIWSNEYAQRLDGVRSQYKTRKAVTQFSSRLVLSAG